VRWIAYHETSVAVLGLALSMAPLIMMALSGSNPHFLFISLVISFVLNVAIVYCNMVARQRIPAWLFIFYGPHAGYACCGPRCLFRFLCESA
jgi:hypothetical protein